MVCVEIVWEQLVMTYGTTHNMDTFFPIIFIQISLGSNAETFFVF